MIGRTSIRVVLCLVVALAFLSGSMAAVSACDGAEIECESGADVDQSGSNATYVEGGASGGADLTDLEHVTTEHSVSVGIHSGVADASADASVARP
jgi:hypothetical protein